MYIFAKIIFMDTFNVNFEDIIKSKLYSGTTLADEVIVFDRKYLTSKYILNPETTSPIRLTNAHAFILCTYGEISFSVNYKPYRLTKGSYLALSSLHIIDKIHISNNCEVVGMIISRDLTMSIHRDTPVAKKIMKNVKGRLEPVIKLDDVEMKNLTEIVERVKNHLKKPDHSFQRQLVKNEVSNFIMEIAHIYLQKHSGDNTTPTKENRSEEISRSFIQLGLKHFKEQHEVAYYASELGVTPDHLSRTVTAATGKSPLQWINGVLINEAKTLLRKPDASIKQVADELHFGDQSSFGKFFKRHEGLTPVEYRNREQGKK
jgi:AraC-like DNA-binding protein